MAWTSLRNSLGNKPRVLVVPILRKVTPGSVTLSLTLRIGATVTLTLRDDDDKKVTKGSRAVGRGELQFAYNYLT